MSNFMCSLKYSILKLTKRFTGYSIYVFSQIGMILMYIIYHTYAHYKLSVNDSRNVIHVCKVSDDDSYKEGASLSFTEFGSYFLI